MLARCGECWQGVVNVEKVCSMLVRCIECWQSVVNAGKGDANVVKRIVIVAIR